MITVIEIGGRCIYTGHTFTFMVSVRNTISLSCYSYSSVLLFYCPLTGVYISKIMYVRRGERSLDGYYKPYHTVVYYRYLRFFPDGMYNIHSSIPIIGERERANPCEQLGTFFRLYICDDPRSQKYGHVIRVSKIRKMENVSIVQCSCG